MAVAGAQHGTRPVTDGLLTVYVGMPIDQATGRLLQPWHVLVGTFCDHLIRFTPNIAIYRPDQAFNVRASRPDLRLEITNRACLERADAVVIFLPAGVPTIGTHREIEFAQDRGIPLLVLTDISGSFALADCETLPLREDQFPAVIDWVEQQRGSSPMRQQIHEPLCFAPIDPRQHHRLPTRAHDADAGYDLYTSRVTRILAGQSADVPTNIRMVLPDGVWGQITGRSSTLRRRGLIVVGAVLDTGWRGELFASVQNVGETDQTIQPDERISQLILHANLAPSFRPIMLPLDRFDEIPAPDNRGLAGFGSSGN